MFQKQYLNKNVATTKAIELGKIVEMTTVQFYFEDCGNYSCIFEGRELKTNKPGNLDDFVDNVIRLYRVNGGFGRGNNHVEWIWTHNHGHRVEAGTLQLFVVRKKSWKVDCLA